ncbi:MAG: hypothetical protein ACI4XM_05185 [Candidatus Coprovivens sp.]
MNILEVNKYTLANLYEEYPESFKDLRLDGNYLVYNGEKTDISKFNINDLLSGETNFAASLSVLSSEDIFKIIRLHALHLESINNKKKDNNERKIEIIKKENPLMKNISIVTRNVDGYEDEYINIVDSTGDDHLFQNDRNVNVFDIYNILRIKNPGRDITPDELISEINRKLYEVRMQESSTILDSSATSEDFDNKITRVADPYKGDKSTRVYGNEENDIAIVKDLDDPTNHDVVTFDQNEFGDLVVQNHEQNVVGTDTSVKSDTTIEETSFESGTNEEENTESEVFEKDEEEVVALLISSQEFYDLLNSNDELTEEQRKSIDLYYAYLGDLVLYEDYLLPELKQILNQFRSYVYELQYGEVAEDELKQINKKQQEAIDKSIAMEEKAALANQEELTEDKIKDSVKKLELVKPVNNYENAGSVSVVQVLAFIIGVSIILTAITLYLIG